MPRYRVTLRRNAVEIVEATNPYMAAIVAREIHGEGVEVAEVRPAVGRAPAGATVRKAGKATKNTAKKRRPMSAETRAKLAKNLVKARAARAAKAKSAKVGKKGTRTTKKR